MRKKIFFHFLQFFSYSWDFQVFPLNAVKLNNNNNNLWSKLVSLEPTVRRIEVQKWFCHKSAIFMLFAVQNCRSIFVFDSLSIIFHLLLRQNKTFYFYWSANWSIDSISPARWCMNVNFFPHCGNIPLYGSLWKTTWWECRNRLAILSVFFFCVVFKLSCFHQHFFYWYL